MSSTRLVLTPFNIEINNLNNYELYERDFIPQQNVPYFVYHDKPNNPIDIKNINLIKHIFGFAKANKGNYSINDTHTNNVGDIKAEKSFTNKRTKAIEKMYNDLSKMILKTLHDITWNTYNYEIIVDKDGNEIKKTEKYVLSSLDWEEFMPLIEKAVKIFEIVNTKVINDKYNIKYSSIEVEQAVEKVKLETDQMIGKKMNKK